MYVDYGEQKSPFRAALTTHDRAPLAPPVASAPVVAYISALLLRMRRPTEVRTDGPPKDSATNAPHTALTAQNLQKCSNNDSSSHCIRHESNHYTLRTCATRRALDPHSCALWLVDRSCPSHAAARKEGEGDGHRFLPSMPFLCTKMIAPPLCPKTCRFETHTPFLYPQTAARPSTAPTRARKRTAAPQAEARKGPRGRGATTATRPNGGAGEAPAIVAARGAPADAGRGRCPLTADSQPPARARQQE